MSVPDVQIRVAKASIAGVLETLKAVGLDDDEELKLDTLEGETNLKELVAWLLDGCEEDEGTIDALKVQIDKRKTRAERLKARIEARRTAVIELMQSAQLKKLPLAEATLSLRALDPRPKITDVNALPLGFYNIEEVRKPDMDAIGAAFDKGELVAGVTKTNGGMSLTVRRS